MTDEYITREAALEVVNGWREQLIPTYGENDEYVKCLETVAEHLYFIPAADVAPVVRGRWVDGKCDNCGEHAPYWCLATTFHESNYCPNCGANEVWSNSITGETSVGWWQNEGGEEHGK